MPLKPTDKKKITENFKRIVQGLHPDAIIDSLITDMVISLDDSQIIYSKPTYNGRSRELVRLLIQGPERGYESFLKSLREDGSYRQLAKDIEETEVPEDKPWMIDVEELPLKPTDVRKIKKHFKEIVECLSVDKIIDSLITHEVLSLEDLEIIDAKPTPKGKNRELIQLLRKGPERGYHIFLESLKEHEAYKELAEKINKTILHEEKRETIERWIGKDGLPVEKANKLLTETDLQYFSQSIQPEHLSMIAPIFEHSEKCHELLSNWKNRLGKTATADKLLELLFVAWSASNESIDESKILHTINQL